MRYSYFPYRIENRRTEKTIRCDTITPYIYIINLNGNKSFFRFLYNHLASELEIIGIYIDIYLAKE
jgi:hypothetical protein